MDADSPAAARIAGEPTPAVGALFTAGKPRKRFTWTCRNRFGSGSVRRRARGYRGSPASRRLPVGEGPHR